MVEKIELTFLGTGSSIPTVRRNHPAVLLKYKSETILFDCGEGTQRQFRMAKLNPCRITKILISHWHGDHVLGLPGLLQTLNLNGYNGDLVIYGPKGSKSDFKEMVAPYLGFLRLKENSLNVIVKEVSAGVIFENDEYLIEAGSVDHGCAALSYSFVVKDKMRLDKKKLDKMNIPNGPLLGKVARGETIEVNGKKINGKGLLYEEKGRKVSYIADTRFGEGLIDFAKESDLLICESTYQDGEEEIAEEHGHMTCTQSAEVAKKSKSNALVLFHLSQRYEDIPKVLEKQAQKVFKNSVVVEDLDEFVL